MKKVKKGEWRPNFNPAFVRIHVDQIKEVQYSILSAAVFKQEVEAEIREGHSTIYSHSLMEMLMKLIRYYFREIRRLRGWLPD